MLKICKKKVHGNDKNNLPWAFKYWVYNSVKYSDLKYFLKARFVIFKCQKYVKKGYMEMKKTIYLEP